jgi:hypothetical protein
MPTPTRARSSDRRFARSLLTGLAAVTLVVALPEARPPDTLRSVGGLPPHLTGLFEEAAGFQQMASGLYVVFDRRAHAVYTIDPAQREATKIIDIGPEQGRLLGPTAFDAAGQTIVVADSPNMVERIQLFDENGQRTGGFLLPGKATPRVTLGRLMLSGISSLQFTGRSLLLNQPETGALVTEYGLGGTPVRTFGALRATGHEADRDVHLALNVGLPIINPKGGYYFVFQTGEPRFRKYAADGALQLERLIQGKEIDSLVQAIPTTWPRRAVEAEVVLPLVPPLVQAAAADPDGNLWISFTVPYTYVFDPDGDRIGSVQLRAAGTLSPASLFFTSRSRLLVTPGLYEFDVGPVGR